MPVDENGHVTLRKQGDAAFEKSRNAALAAYEKMRKEKQANPAKPSLDDLVAGLTERQKKALARKLLGL